MVNETFDFSGVYKLLVVVVIFYSIVDTFAVVVLLKHIKKRVSK